MNRSGVSIVIPTRDRSHLLELTLRSVLNQRGIGIEVIVVDDGDDSRTAGVVNAFEDPRVQLVINDGPPGVSGARNRGVRAATREWIAFCDDDDLWAPDKLRRQLSAAAEQRAAWVYAGEVHVDADLRVLSGGPPPGPDALMRELPHHNAVPAGASNVVVRAEALARVGPFDPGLRTSEDWDVWLRLARTAGRPACTAHPLVALRIHHGMASRAAGQVMEDIEVIARRHRIPVDWARHHRWAAWMAWEEADPGRAVRHYVRAIKAGDWRSAGRAMVALLDPGLARRHRAVLKDSWISEAETWLDALRETGGARL